MNRTLAAIAIIAASFCLAAGAVESKQAVVAVLVAPGEQADRGADIQEVDPTTRKMRCIAHKDKTPVAAVLRDGGWLYVGARDGIYRYRMP